MKSAPNGWLKLHRSLIENWIWEDPLFLKWWIDLLYLAAWKPMSIVVINNKVELNRGQLVASVRYLQTRWSESTRGHNRPSVKKIHNFLCLLEKCGCISRSFCLPRKTGLITITNYDKYQSLEEPIKGDAEIDQNKCSAKPSKQTSKPKTVSIPDDTKENKVSHSIFVKISTNNKSMQMTTHEQDKLWLNEFFGPNYSEIHLRLLCDFKRVNPLATSVEYLKRLADEAMLDWDIVRDGGHQDFSDFRRHLLYVMRTKNNIYGSFARKHLNAQLNQYNYGNTQNYGTGTNRANNYEIARQRGDDECKKALAFFASI